MEFGHIPRSYVDLVVLRIIYKPFYGGRIPGYGEDMVLIRKKTTLQFKTTSRVFMPVAIPMKGSVHFIFPAISSYHFHDVDFTTCRPTDRGNVITQHP